MSVNTEKLRNFHFGGVEYVEHIQRCYELISKEPLFQMKDDVSNLNMEEQRLRTMQQMRRLVELNWDNLDDFMKKVYSYQACFDAGMSGQIALSLHRLFCMTVERLGTDDQKEFYVDSELTRSLKVLGCFCLTEMTHGSDSRRMKTVAVYDCDSQEFVLNTPDQEAYKCWIGNLGKHATHGVIGAQLIIGTKNYGLHWFIVPLRDLETHECLPGIQIGDFGFKTSLQWNAMDNGYLKMKNIRVPLRNMLNKYQEVTPEGEYRIKIKDKKMLFGLTLASLSEGRVSIGNDVLQRSRLSLSIALRYSLQRKQFGTPEKPIIDYQLQQYQLIPRLASYFAMNQFAIWQWDKYNVIETRKTIDSTFLDMNSEIHALSCGFKAVAGYFARETTSLCRECCGGHGFLGISRLTAIQTNMEPAITYEGSNNVILLQVGKSLLNHLKPLQIGKKVISPFGTFDYLNYLPLLPTMSCHSKKSFFGLDDLNLALKQRSLYLLKESVDKLQKKLGKGSSIENAFNDSQVMHFNSAAKAHIEYVIFLKARESIVSQIGTELEQILTHLVIVYGLFVLVQDYGTMLESCYWSSIHGKAAKANLLKLTKALRPHIPQLIDAISPPDNILQSAIGGQKNYVSSILQRLEADPSNYSRPGYWKLLRSKL